MVVYQEPRPRTIALSVATLAVSAGLLTLASAMLSGCESKGASATAAPPQAMPVSVVKAAQKDVPVTGEWVGTLDGYVNAQIQPQANGYLVKQDYREGSQVEKG